MSGERLAAPRRVQVLAIIVESILRFGVCPCYDEIGRAMVPRISISRVKQHVDALVQLKCIDRAIAAQRGIRIQDLNLCRRMIEEWLGPKEWLNFRLFGSAESAAPCTIEQLPLIPPFEHIPGTI